MAPARISSHAPRRKVAIVGSGCAGLGAAWALRESDCEVHLFEKSAKLGGHTNTQTWHHNEKSVPVDTGFIVMNAATYPNFLRFLAEVGIEPVETEMTFGISRDHGNFEWSGEPRGIFAQRRNIFSPKHWRMIFDIVRFNQFALDLLAEDDESGLSRLGSTPRHRKYARDITIGQYLDVEGYSQGFRDDYLIPMTAAVWSTSPDKASLSFPALTLVRFMWNHHLLSTLAVRPPWLTIPGGSQRYIDAILSSFDSDKLHIHTSSAITSIRRPKNQHSSPVGLSWTDPTTLKPLTDTFDHVVLAGHGDEILPLLSADTPSADELDVFSAFQTTENTTYFHSDLSLMPRRRKVWTAWNYLIESTPSKLSSPAGVSLTYCMNILQHLPEETYGPVLVTMNPGHPPEPSLTQGKFVYRHPLYTPESVRAQKRLEGLQNTRGVSYCGAWTKYGFHEDGFSSGLRVAKEHLGAELPFEFVDSTYSRGHKPELNWKDYVLRVVLMAVLLWIKVVEMILRIPGVGVVVGVLGQVGGMVLDMAEFAGLIND